MKLTRLKQRGDTIVEVILAIAVVSTVIAASFTSANRSLTGTVSSQERAEALKVAEGQVEFLQELARDQDESEVIFDSTRTLFCISVSGGDIVRRNFTSNSLPALESDNFNRPPYNQNCLDYNSTRYNVSIQYNPGSNDTFTVRARWDGPTGLKEEVRLIFRAHERVNVAISSPPSPPPPGAGLCTITPNPVVIPSVPEAHLQYSTSLGNIRQTYSVDIDSETAGMEDGCRFTIFITTRDNAHPSGEPQPEERLFATFVLEGGGEVTTGLTRDLETEDFSTTTNVGDYTFPTRPVEIIFKHYSLWPGCSTTPPAPNCGAPNSNSIEAATVEFDLISAP